MEGLTDEERYGARVSYLQGMFADNGLPSYEPADREHFHQVWGMSIEQFRFIMAQIAVMPRLLMATPLTTLFHLINVDGIRGEKFADREKGVEGVSVPPTFPRGTLQAPLEEALMGTMIIAATFDNLKRDIWARPMDVQEFREAS